MYQFGALTIANALTTLVALGTLALGCTGTETGNPFTHEIEPTAFDTAVTAATPTFPSITEISIRGAAGSVTPATGRVHAWALENNLPGVSVPVEPDGSFSLELQALPEDVIRIQVRASAKELSAPFDLAVNRLGVGFQPVTSRLPCLQTSPPGSLELDAIGGSEDAILISNLCEETVIRSPARIREGLPGLSIVDDGVLELAPGARSSVTVRVTAAGPSLDNVVFSISSPVQEIRAVTVGTN